LLEDKRQVCRGGLVLCISNGNDFANLLYIKFEERLDERFMPSDSGAVAVRKEE
jgi:hypothetical protein